jgi:hypothetical protein
MLRSAIARARNGWGGADDTGMGSTAGSQGKGAGLSRSLPEGPCPWQLRGAAGIATRPVVRSR